MINWKNVRFLDCRLCEGPMDSHQIFYSGSPRIVDCEHSICGFCMFRFELSLNGSWRKEWERHVYQLREQWSRHRIELCPNIKCGGAFDHACICKPQKSPPCGDLNQCAHGWWDCDNFYISQPPPPDRVPRALRFNLWLVNELRRIAAERPAKISRKRKLTFLMHK